MESFLDGSYRTFHNAAVKLFDQRIHLGILAERFVSGLLQFSAFQLLGLVRGCGSGDACLDMYATADAKKRVERIAQAFGVRGIIETSMLFIQHEMQLVPVHALQAAVRGGIANHACQWQ